MVQDTTCAPIQTHLLVLPHWRVEIHEFFQQDLPSGPWWRLRGPVTPTTTKKGVPVSLLLFWGERCSRVSPLVVFLSLKRRLDTRVPPARPPEKDSIRRTGHPALRPTSPDSKGASGRPAWREGPSGVRVQCPSLIKPRVSGAGDERMHRKKMVILV